MLFCNVLWFLWYTKKNVSFNNDENVYENTNLTPYIIMESECKKVKNMEIRYLRGFPSKMYINPASNKC